jgi:hypothetical protein
MFITYTCKQFLDIPQSWKVLEQNEHKKWAQNKSTTKKRSVMRKDIVKEVRVSCEIGRENET